MIEEKKPMVSPINETMNYIPNYLIKSGRKLKLRLCNPSQRAIDKHIREGYVYITNKDLGWVKDDLHPKRALNKTAIVDGMVVMGIPVEIIKEQLKNNKELNESRKNKLMGNIKTSINKDARDILHTRGDITIGDSFKDENL